MLPVLAVSGFWSVVTPVPIGDHEFKFIVDGVWRVSKVHPLAGEGGNEVNFRSVKGIAPFGFLSWTRKT